MSTAIHLGADKILVISLRSPQVASFERSSGDEPSVGHMMGFLLDTLFADHLDADWAQLNSINHWLSQGRIIDPKYRSIDASWVAPMTDLGNTVGEYYDEMPLSLRVLFKTLGLDRTRGEALASFVLFDRVYTRTLINEGYRDANRQRSELMSFLEIS